MKAKTKNPLYVIKGKDVQEVTDVFDLVIKKFNLEPVIQVMQNLLKLILDNMKTYPAFIAMKEFLDDLIAKYVFLLKKLGIA